MTALGIDVGGTFVRAGVVEADGRIVASGRVALDDRSPEAVVEAIAAAAHRAEERAGATPAGACGIGVAAQLDGGGGQVSVAPNLGWREVPFGALVSRRLGRAVRVVNDLKAAAWGELRAGAARGDREVYVLFVGSGVGSAIISGGQLVWGARGLAGEIGHIKVVESDGRPCGCGKRGCLEAYAGGHSLIAQMREALAAGQASETSLAGLTPVVLEQAAIAGDPAAREIYERAIGHLGLALGNQITVLNPAHVILGGGVLSHCSQMRERVADRALRLAAEVSRRGVKISQAALGDDSGLIGAALLASEAGP